MQQMIDNIEEFKSLIATIKKIAEADKSEELLSLFAKAEITIRQTGYDNWNGGIYYYTVYFQVEIKKFIELRNNLDQWEDKLLNDFSLPIRHLENEEISRVTIIPKTNIIPSPELNPHRPLSPLEVKRKEELATYLNTASEDELIEHLLMPLFRHLGFHRITITGHNDKQLEYGKDIWMKFTLPTQHYLYFGIQVKKGKLDSSGVTKGTNANVAEVYKQVLMMLGHEIFDPEIGKKVLVDHAFIVAGGEITKAARNWLAGQLDASQRRHIIFMDRDDILNLFIVNDITLPKGVVEQVKPQEDDLPF